MGLARDGEIARDKSVPGFPICASRINNHQMKAGSAPMACRGARTSKHSIMFLCSARVICSKL